MYQSPFIITLELKKLRFLMCFFILMMAVLLLDFQTNPWPGLQFLMMTVRQSTVLIIHRHVHFIAGIRLSFEQSTYLVTQKRIEVCVKKSGKHDFPITVQIQNQDAQGTTKSITQLTNLLYVSVWL